jgi:hypothetical protein
MVKKMWQWPAIGLILGGLTIGLKLIGGFFPLTVERIYSRSLFPGVRFVLDHTIGLLPFSAIYLLLVFFPVWILLRLRHRQRRENVGWLRRGGRVLLSLLGVMGLILTAGYGLWGFNYDRLPLDRQLGLELRPLDEGMIRDGSREMAENLIRTRAQISRSSSPLRHDDLPGDLEGALRSSFTKVLADLHYPQPGRVRLRMLVPGSLLMRLGIAGFYFPFTGEANLPATLTAVEIPFAAAHEMAHAYGFADEGEANLVAYLVCVRSAHPILRYSGQMGYFSYIWSELYRVSPQAYQALGTQLSAGVLADIRQKRENWQVYRSWLSEAGEAVNNLYLKSQGVREGIMSYNRLLVLYEAYRKKTRTRERGIRTNTDRCGLTQTGGQEKSSQ